MSQSSSPKARTVWGILRVAVAARLKRLFVEPLEVGDCDFARIEIACPLPVGFFGHRRNTLWIDFQIRERAGHAGHIQKRLDAGDKSFDRAINAFADARDLRRRGE